MKNQSMGTGDKKKKGFYAAIAAGAGAVMVLALVISFSNLTITSPNPQLLYESEYEYQEDLYGEEAVVAGVDYTIPYLAQADLDQALFRPRSTPAPEPSGQPSEEAPPASAVPQAPRSPEAPEGNQQTTPVTEHPATQEQQDPPAADPQAAPEVPVSAEEPARGNISNDQPAPAVPSREADPPAAESADAAEILEAEFASFDPFIRADRLVWPVYGDIAMIFSQNRLIYNPTLDQWRTNDDLRISAREGTPVRAAAAGVIREVGSDRVYGNFVRIDNGNGWETIHAQLMDGILVVEGDIVQAGQVIGGVGRPSVFSVLNGHHLSLRVLHEDNLVDPILWLADIQE